MWPSVAHARATWVLMGAESLCGWALPSGPAPCWPVYSYVPITGAPVPPPHVCPRPFSLQWRRVLSRICLLRKVTDFLLGLTEKTGSSAWPGARREVAVSHSHAHQRGFLCSPLHIPPTCRAVTSHWNLSATQSLLLQESRRRADF